MSYIVKIKLNFFFFTFYFVCFYPIPALKQSKLACLTQTLPLFPPFLPPFLQSTSHLSTSHSPPSPIPALALRPRHLDGGREGREQDGEMDMMEGCGRSGLWLAGLLCYSAFPTLTSDVRQHKRLREGGGEF